RRLAHFSLRNAHGARRAKVRNRPTNDIVRRILEVADPERIIMFGFAALINRSAGRSSPVISAQSVPI
ncbi:MAG: hypothetical protein KGZ25_11345, partial [Planctomycetes bacterium]|nr:hypothetical protein [Planctomycetota bacterium]